MTQEEKDRRDANEQRLATIARGCVLLMGQRLREATRYRPRLRRCRCGTALEEEVRCRTCSKGEPC